MDADVDAFGSFGTLLARVLGAYELRTSISDSGEHKSTTAVMRCRAISLFLVSLTKITSSSADVEATATEFELSSMNTTLSVNLKEK